MKNFIGIVVSSATILVFSFNQSFGSIANLAPVVDQVSPLSTVEDFRRAYPNATIITLAATNLKTEELSSQPSVPPPPPQPSLITPDEGFDDPCRSINETVSQERATISGAQNSGAITPDFSFNSFSKSSKEADKSILIVLAVVGVVVVAVLAVYSISYLFMAIRNGIKCRGRHELGFRFSGIYDSSKTQIRYGQMTGIIYTLGFGVPFGLMGLALEGGSHTTHITINETNEEADYRGSYLLAGPRFVFFTALGILHSFQIELLVGTSSVAEIGLMGTLRLGLELKISDRFGFGLNTGAALIKIKGFDNFIKDDDQINYLTGVGFAYRW